MKNIMLAAAEKVCGKTKGGKQVKKETWWWDTGVQDSIKEKKDKFRKWQKRETTPRKKSTQKLKRKKK